MTPHTTLDRPPIDANALEAMARERPDDKFLKGSGVLKLIGAIRQLEGELRTLRMADPAAGISRELLGKIVDEAFGGSIEDTTPIEDIYRIVVRDVPRRLTPNLENLQDRLLAPTSIERDDIGHWYHPHLPDCDEGVHYGDLLAVFGMEVATVAMEGDATEEVAERYFEQGGPDCSDWTPTPPEGEGWTLLAIFDTEDGPHAMFARKAPPEQFARNYIGPRRWAQRLVKFLNAAAGEGLVLDGIDAADLFTEVLPKTYKAALREADAASEAPTLIWPKARDVGRLGDMSPSAHLRVGLDSDNDAYVSVWDEKGGASIEFCTPGSGGGKSSRTRMALVALMVAMEADNADTPSLDWWALRMNGSQAPKGGA